MAECFIYPALSQPSKTTKQQNNKTTKQLSQQLRLVIADLQSLQATVDNKQLKQHLDAQLITKPLLHPWQMYQNTLHEVKSNIDGEQ